MAKMKQSLFLMLFFSILNHARCLQYQFWYNNQIQTLSMEAIKSFFIKIGNGFTRAGSWIGEKYRNNRKKCRGIIITILLLILLAGLIWGSFKSVDSISQGVPINYTDGTIIDQSVTNYGSFMGLNTYYKTFPNVYFLVSFDNTVKDKANKFSPVKARVIEGTLLEIQVYAKVKLVPTNLKSFLENFGIQVVDGVNEGWQIYIKEKIRNVVVQQVAKLKFHEVTNQVLTKAINTELISYETNSSIYYPFIIRIVGLNIQYPQKTMKANNTLGTKLLEQTSRLKQLNNKLDNLKKDYSKYETIAQNYQIKRATLDGQIRNSENAVKLAGSKWIQGIQLFNSTVRNETLVQKYLQIYFNSLYNVTYRIQSLQPFKI